MERYEGSSPRRRRKEAIMDGVIADCGGAEGQADEAPMVTRYSCVKSMSISTPHSVDIAR